jgi:hypothetical protein
MKLLFITNIPSPYRIDFFNQLGKFVELTVIFEAKKAEGINFNWNFYKKNHFLSIFLSNEKIKEKRINFKIIKYLKKNKYDFIIISNYSYFTEMIALLYLKIAKIPYIFEVDGGIIRRENIF